MSLNCEEINIILNELNLEGSFIQGIVQPGFDSLALYTYKEGTARTVFISLANGACRINETRKKIPKNEKPLRFMEFLKSRIKGCRIDNCEQIGKERVIRLALSHIVGENDEVENLFLFIRLWSGSANIFLTDENLKILDCFYRRPNKNEVGGRFFTPPDICVDDGKPFDEAKKKFSPRTFDEIEGGTYNEKVETFYSEHGSALSRESILAQAEKYYKEHREKIEGAIKRLEAKRAEFLKNDELRHLGDLLLSCPNDKIQETKDGSFIECEDYENSKRVKIAVNPKKTLQENAREYYERYKKAASGLEDLEHDIFRSKRELLDLESQYEAILKEPNPVRMQQLLRKHTKPKQQIQKKHPGVAYMVDGWYILVGRDANENDELLRHHVRGQDMWMHTRDFAGGYVFIKNRPGKTIPLEILLDAGNLAVHHSKARKAGQADLYYTQVKYLRRAKNGPKGLVLPTHEKNLTIKIEEKRLKKLEENQIDD